MYCGVDEAGKGAVIGPMVVAGVGIGDIRDLDNLGLRDSKALTPARREEFYDLLTCRFMYVVRVVTATEIDTARRSMTMNTLVAGLHASVIEEIGATHAFVDACDVNAERYGEVVHRMAGGRCIVIAEHHADRVRPLVSAASIIAKVTRDREISLLSGMHGDIGSGYPSDPITISYLEDYIQREERGPPFARSSWETVVSMIRRRHQAELSDFR